jgi:fatty acyl-CoA reductase
VRAEHPNFVEKIEGVEGDLLKPNLGISEQFCEILQKEVQVVFHVAATVRFDSPLKEAAYINVRSTRDLLEIAKSMERLEVNWYYIFHLRVKWFFQFPHFSFKIVSR